MEYLTLKELTAKFAMPERTAYYKLANHSRIRTKKRGRSKLVHVADFAKACNLNLQDLQPIAETQDNKKVEVPEQSDIARLQTNLQELQTQHSLVLSEKSHLEKRNRNLEEMAQSHALALKEEKKEKLHIQEKLDQSLERYTQTIQEFGQERLKNQQTQHLYLGMAVFFGLLLLIFQQSAIIDVLLDIFA